jgi:hypothetical protein
MASQQYSTDDVIAAECRVPSVVFEDQWMRVGAVTAGGRRLQQFRRLQVGAVTSCASETRLGGAKPGTVRSFRCSALGSGFQDCRSGCKDARQRQKSELRFWRVNLECAPSAPTSRCLSIVGAGLLHAQQHNAVECAQRV